MHSSATLWACFVMETSQKVQLRIVFKLGATLAPVCFVKGKTLKRFKMNQTFCGAKEKTPNNENCLLFCYISQCVAKTILEKKNRSRNAESSISPLNMTRQLLSDTSNRNHNLTIVEKIEKPTAGRLSLLKTAKQSYFFANARKTEDGKSACEARARLALEDPCFRRFARLPKSGLGKKNCFAVYNNSDKTDHPTTCTLRYN